MKKIIAIAASIAILALTAQAQTEATGQTSPRPAAATPAAVSAQRKAMSPRQVHPRPTATISTARDASGQRRPVATPPSGTAPVRTPQAIPATNK